MPLSDDTIRRMRTLIARVDEVVEAFGGAITRADAWNMVTADSGMKAAEIAERIEARQKKDEQAQLRASAAYSSTYKANINGGEELKSE